MAKGKGAVISKEAGIVVPGQPGSYSEIQRLREQVRQDEEYLEGVNRGAGEGYELPHGEAHGIDVERIQERLARTKAQLAKMDPANQELSGEQRAKAEKRLKEIEDRFSKSLVKKSLMRLRPADTDFGRAVGLHEAEQSDPQIQAMKEEYQALARVVYPDDPDMASVERLRPD